ncbi:type II toxin-antitoxin system RelE/ParE family toxin [Rhizobium sp. SIMBA_035]
MSQRYRLRYHPDATDDLIKIFTLIEHYAGTEIANRKLSEIERATKGLTDFPHKASPRDEVQPGLRVLPAAEKAVICFTVDDADKSVLILAVGYAGSDWAARVKERG